MYSVTFHYSAIGMDKQSTGASFIGSKVSIRRVAYSNNCFMFVSAHFQMLNQIASICLGRAAPLMGPLCHYNLTGIH